jgi:hypothetical protein
MTHIPLLLKRLALATSSWLIAAGFIAPATAQPNLAVIAEENAPIVAIVHDLPGILRLWGKSPVAATLNDPGLRQFLKKIDALRSITPIPATADSRALELFIKQILEMTRSVIFTLSDFDPASADVTFDSAIIAADFGTNLKEIEHFINEQLTAAVAKGELRRRTETHRDLTLHVENSYDSLGRQNTFYWAAVNTVLVGSANRAKITAAIDRLQNAGASVSFAMTPRYSRMTRTVGMAQITYAVSIKHLFAIAKKTASGQLKQNSADGMINIDTLDTVLGLDSFDDAFFGIIFDKNDMQLSGACTYTNPRGLMKILAPKPGYLPQPPFLPITWPGATVTHFDAGDTFASLKESVRLAAPFFGMILDQQIATINQKAGINLESDLLHNIDGCIITGKYAPTPNSADTNIFLAFPLKQPDSFERGFQGVLAAAELPVTTTRLGNITIHRVSNGRNGPGSSFEYTIIRDHFLACGGSGGIEQAVRCWAGQTPSIWTDTRMLEMAALLPGDACGISRNSLREFARTWFIPIGVAMQRAAIISAETAANPSFDPSQLKITPPVKAPSFDSLRSYQVYTYFYRKTDGTYFRTKIINNQK